MRNMFAKVLTELVAKDEEAILFYADIGNRLFNPLKEIDQNRAINAGIAEANMTSMAAGVAKMGMKPFIYTITPFLTARNFEQIKIDIAYQNLPVIIVGTGSGMSYANLGPTHHSFEDIALIRALPNMNIVCPADEVELEVLMPQIYKLNQPCYFRIGKKNEPINYETKPDLTFGKAHVIETGSEITILSTGTILPLAKQLQLELKKRGYTPELTSFHTVKPIDEIYLKYVSTQFKHIITLEEHNIHGGFGSAVLEWCNEQQASLQVHRFGLPNRFIDQVSSRASALDKAGLNLDTIMKSLEQRMR